MTLKVTGTYENEGNIERTFIATVDGIEVGGATVTEYADGTQYVDRIDIAEAHRNQGHGTTFLRELGSEYGTLIITPDNEGAQRLYERLGCTVSDRDYDATWCYVDQGFGVYEV